MFILKLIIYLILIIGPIVAIWMYIKMKRAQEEIDWLKEQRFVLLRIMVPKNNEKTPLAAEQMFAALHGIFQSDQRFQKYLSLEIASRDKYIQFYVAAPVELKDFVEGQIYAQYPTVEIEEINDYASPESLDLKQKALAKELIFAGVDLKLNKRDVFPISTFPNFDVDPLAGITGVLSKIRPEEEVWIQILTRPVGDNWQVRGTSYVKALQSGLKVDGGGSIVKTLARGIFSFIIDFVRGFLAQPSESKEDKKGAGPKIPAMENDKEGATTEGVSLNAVEQKATKLGFETLIRVAAISTSEISAKGKINSVVGAFKQYNSTHLNGFKADTITFDEEFLRRFQSRAFLGESYIFNIEELASIFHLPNISVETPTIVWAGSKKGEPPANLPIQGSVPDEEITLFAETDFRHLIHHFGIKLQDRRYHMYAIGKTGTGKSTLLENMIIDDIKEGRGVAIVDPHGDLIKHVIDFIPARRINDVVLFDPSDSNFPVAFNILENVDPDLKNIVASGVVGIFKKIFGESWGPRLEYILRNTVLALLDYPGATMIGIMRLLTDKNYRKKVIEKIEDPVIKDFFINEYEKYDQKFRTEAIAPIQNKVGQFLSSSTIRNIVGQSKSTINIEKIMNEGKILLLDLSIGKIGEDNSALLGAMMITKIQLAAMRRALVPEEQRRDFYLYVDEFQNFATDSFAVILSEARKYHLNLIMTNQYIAQMPEVVANAVFGNVGTMVSFRVGAADATSLLKEFEPVFVENDMVNLDNYHIYVKMAIDGVTCPAFSAVTLSPKRNPSENRSKIIAVSREHYSKKREEVESKIKEWAEQESVPGGELTKKLVQTGSVPADGKDIAKNDEVDARKIRAGESEYREIVQKSGAKWYAGESKNKKSNNFLRHSASANKPLITKQDIEALNKNKQDKQVQNREVMSSDGNSKDGNSKVGSKEGRREIRPIK